MGPLRVLGKGWRMARAFIGDTSPWEGYRVEAEEFRELDDTRVLVLIRQRGLGRTSEIELRA